MDEMVERAYHELVELLHYLPPDEAGQVARAFECARLAHGPARRKSGEPYITHPLAVAAMLAHMRMDVATLSAALLHDVLEDTQLTSKTLSEQFGTDVAQLVERVTKLDMDKVMQLPGAELSYDQVEAASLVHLFMAMAADLRVIAIKLCDRLHNMRTVDALKPDKRLRMAHETLELFAPVAARLGIWGIKKELEDLGLKVISPDDYAEIEQMLLARTKLLEQDMSDTISHLRAMLAEEVIPAEVESLPEHIYGLYRYIQSYGLENARLYDGMRVCVVVDTLLECYMTLGVIHSLWQPVPGQVIDFIAAPKDGLYRSLHTVVMSLRGHLLEVRIRTRQMHHLSEFGVIACLQCPREDIWPPVDPSVHVSWLEQLGQLPSDDPAAFLESFKSQIAQSHIIRVFTPKGDVIELPLGATPIDFAYAVHTEIGHSCHKALVDGFFVPLSTRLHDGAQVEIVKSSTPYPDRAWLDVDLGCVGNPATTHRLIRRWFWRQPEPFLIEQGRQIVEEEIRSWGGDAEQIESGLSRLARKRHVPVEYLCLRVGRCEISAHELALVVLSEILNWPTREPLGSVALDIYAADRPGLLRDACQVVADDNVNVESASVLSSDEQGLAHMQLALAIQKMDQIVRIAHRLERITGVIQLRCVGLQA
ncbi:MAG: bifunctional (p)ppGpp synthetase/guanosine-3',5'-bis(diphosphate) 3'-pyrophosphohydrolase [Thermoflexales bacterium]|nr:bifunctional (p)ppGpp synthetase/guanosine-3',5'-bis(diphosphate) 3'-pyrophosphohydrolase [Thermoflexales bacterium]